MKIKSNSKKTVWYALDNAAKIYPPTASKDRPHTFAFSALITEDVDPFILREAVSSLLTHFPTFKTKLMAGKFWYYLEENNASVQVFKEQPYYLKQIDFNRNNGFLFEVLYVRNKITVKFFHAVTDGVGGFEFFKALICEYLKATGKDIDTEGILRPLDKPATNSLSEDSFLTVQKHSDEIVEKISKPYHIIGKEFDYDGCGMITAKIDLTKLKELSKEKGVTITAYLGAVYMEAIYEAYLKNSRSKNKQITILIPCNLRKKYGGETSRNFTMFARFTEDYNKDILSFDKLLKDCQSQINDGLDMSKLDKIIDDNVKLERNLFIKLAPLPLKNLIMRIAYSRIGEVLQTVNMSNIGLVNLPESVSKYVKLMTFAIAPTFSCNHQTGIIGYNGYLYVTFSRNFVETELEKIFVRILTNKGVSVDVSSNYWESKI